MWWPRTLADELDMTRAAADLSKSVWSGGGVYISASVAEHGMTCERRYCSSCVGGVAACCFVQERSRIMSNNFCNYVFKSGSACAAAYTWKIFLGVLILPGHFCISAQCGHVSFWFHLTHIRCIWNLFYLCLQMFFIFFYSYIILYIINTIYLYISIYIDLTKTKIL